MVRTTEESREKSRVTAQKKLHVLVCGMDFYEISKKVVVL